MKNKTDSIFELSQYLGLKNLSEQYQAIIQQAHEKQTSYRDFLEQILHQEAIRKRESSIQYRIRESHLPRPFKLLSDFDFAFQTGVRKPLIMELATLEFIKNKESLLLIGDCGTGKSHIAQSLALAAIEEGYKVLYTTCSALITDLNNGVYEKKLAKHLRKYTSADLLIIDEMGHDRLELQLAKEAHLLFKVVDERYLNKRPIIFTTNVEENNWAEYLGDPVSTKAILDRIFHCSLKIQVKGPSYRQYQGKELQKKYDKHR